MNDVTPGLGATSGYEIRIHGHLSERWSDWLEAVTFVHDLDGSTLIHCPALDQAALHGLLAKVRDLGLALISVTPTTTSPDSTRRSNP